LLVVRERCEVCGLDLRACDTGDGAAAGVILVLGAVVVIMAFWVEFRFSPPLWVHAVLWPVVTIPLAILLMRPAKAALVALQFRHGASEMGLGDGRIPSPGQRERKGEVKRACRSTLP